MTFDEMLGSVLQLFPEALFHDDETGEIVISTGFRLEGDNLIPMKGI
jgi:hypothetical protein